VSSSNSTSPREIRPDKECSASRNVEPLKSQERVSDAVVFSLNHRDQNQMLKKTLGNIPLPSRQTPSEGRMSQGWRVLDGKRNRPRAKFARGSADKNVELKELMRVSDAERGRGGTLIR
jgi:hypothetical protein